MNEALDVLLKAKYVTVITGAGISVAAGIPPFRGNDGLYEDRKTTLEDLMHINALNNDTLRPKHCQFIANLARKAAASQATDFHHFLRILHEKKLLRRLYTQNIDTLEEKVGFTAESYIPLHGTLKNLRCISCAHEDSLEARFQELEAGRLPQCTVCRDKPRNWESGELRRRSIGYMRPAILLYGEPASDDFLDTINHDLSKIGSSEVLLVVGTSLKIHTVQEMIKRFATIMREEHGTLIYIDLLKPAKAWDTVFDTILQVDCQDFAKLAITRLSGTEGPAVATYADQVSNRQDKRPFWSWI